MMTLWGRNILSIKLPYRYFSGYVKILLGTVLISIIVPGSLAHAQNSFAQTARDILVDKDIQKELPCITDKDVNEKCQPKKRPKSSNWFGKMLEAIFNFFGPVGIIFKYLFYFLLIAAAAYIIYSLFEKFEWRGGKVRKKAKTKPVKLKVQTAPKSTRTTPPSLEEADSLAEQGDFSAAAHLLLLAGIEVIQKKIRGLLVISDTSRDILRQDKVSAGERDLLRPLIEYVEMSLFAGRDLTGEEYGLCREKYITLKEGGFS